MEKSSTVWVKDNIHVKLILIAVHAVETPTHQMVEIMPTVGPWTGRIVPPYQVTMGRLSKDVYANPVNDVPCARFTLI
jgi:hypothetical protein